MVATAAFDDRQVMLASGLGLPFERNAAAEYRTDVPAYSRPAVRLVTSIRATWGQLT
jgi:hypothetical protein